MYTYKECYKILLIESDCSWNSLRKSYKKLIQKWHPDRFPNENTKLSAEDKIKDLNIAFIQLSKYYKQHGSLPQFHQPEIITPPPTRHGKSPRQNQPPDINKTEDLSQHRTDKDTPSSSYNYIYALLITVISLIMFVYTSTYDEVKETTTRIKTNQKTQSINIDTAGANTPKKEIITTNNTLDARNKLNTKGHNRLKNTQEQHFFTYGSTINDVLNIQGQPDYVDGDFWFYGSSYIKFNDGTVENWKRTPDFPLKANINL